MTLWGLPFLQKIVMMLFSFYGSLDLEKMDRAVGIIVPTKLIFCLGGSKEPNVYVVQ